MKKILVTGARAPSALELCRNLSNAGYIVYAADSMHFPITRFSNTIKRYISYPSPKDSFKKFSKKISSIVNEHSIDWIIPTCEEVFYLSAVKDSLSQNCTIFCDDFKKLSILHNKVNFQKYAEKNGLSHIKTYLLKTKADFIRVQKELKERRYVIKPVYSRFGDKAELNLDIKDIPNKLKGDLFPWALQEHIKGQEYCTYAICNQGQVKFQACYKPSYRAKQGSSVYFTHVIHPKINQQIQRFIKNINYTGQIGFDFIEQQDGKLFVLECNPRCTSGVHFLPLSFNWKEFESTSYTHEPMTSPSKMIGFAMLLYGFQKPNNTKFLSFIKDYREGQDTTWSKQDVFPSLGQALSLGEIIYRSITSGNSLKNAATMDIEWDGEYFG